MAGNKNAALDRTIIDRVVKGLAAKLTDKAGILALIDDARRRSDARGRSSTRPLSRRHRRQAAKRSEAAKAIPEATANLLEPIFVARTAGNHAFLTVYQRALKQALPPLLTNHLIPRVQAMIVLGESGSTEAIDIFEKEIEQSEADALGETLGHRRDQEDQGVRRAFDPPTRRPRPRRSSPISWTIPRTSRCPGPSSFAASKRLRICVKDSCPPSPKRPTWRIRPCDSWPIRKRSWRCVRRRPGRSA